MDTSHFQELQQNELIRNRLAKKIVLHCFRNATELEDLHAGKIT